MKECPFCGSLPKIANQDGMYSNFQIYCDCEANPSIIGGAQEKNISVVTRWNRRSAPNPDAGMVEVMDKLAKVEIPVIIDPGEAKWFYLGLAQGMRSMARAALAALRGKEGGGE